MPERATKPKNVTSGSGEELSVIRRLPRLITRLVASTEKLNPLLSEILDAIIELQNADFGNLQLFNLETRTLEIVAQRGFHRNFLEHLRGVDDNKLICGRAMLTRKRVIVEDVLSDPDFEPHRRIAAAAGFRAVQSTPLFSRNGELLGMVSTHFRHIHCPSKKELELTDLTSASRRR
jgi:GAF domain-containing protein